MVFNYKGPLINENLRDVDPFSPTISDEQKRDIILECRSNIKYLMETLIFTKNDSLLNKLYVSLVEENNKWLG